MSSIRRRDFSGTPRFDVLRCIGAGGMGTVYEALDKERNVRVALKTLRAMNGDALLRFKKEFRDFQDLNHPNLVSVGELFSDGAEWFFSMELIDGQSFLEWVRPGTFAARDSFRVSGTAAAGSPSADTMPGLLSPRGIRVDNVGPSFDEVRLRAGLRQLTEGLSALHDKQKVHRDIKPSNVLVTREGRVVLLDFGLATDLAGREHKSEVDIVGTVEYMAPEQAASRQVGPPADWYAAGVMLYEALTGQVPVSGPAIEVLMNKQRVDAPHPRVINAKIPEDLDALCAELLRFNPSARPTGADVLKRLGAPQSRPSAGSLSSFSSSAFFVGRDRELLTLRGYYEQSRKEAHTVCVHGESGLGKSALARHFIEELRVRDPGVVVLHGTCYERESVPYKAVDGVIDALSQYMRRLPKADAAALLPRKASLLAHVFPVLQRVEAVAEAPREHHHVLDPQELRTRLFAALRELLARLADRYPLVVVIDDLQWADADSMALLGDLLRPPEAPPLLLVATVRSENGESGAVRRVDLTSQLRGVVSQLQLERMSPDEARELAEALARRAPGEVALDGGAIAQEAAGHPLFIDELIRHAIAVGPAAPGGLQLEDALWARISQLDAEARRVLELVSLAGGRLLQQTAAQAAALPFGDFAKHVALLRVAHFLRTTGMRGTDTVEPYHDRVRRAVIGHLTAPSLKAHHHRLAVALETTGQADPEALTVHWREAGDRDKAAHFAIAAADKAAKVLAFDRAARFYQIGLESLQPGGRARSLRVAFADALANAGRGAEAGEAYLLAADGAAPPEALELRRRAAEQYLRSGHIDKGLEAIKTVLGAVGLKWPQTSSKALLSFLLRRTRVRLRGLAFTEHDENQVARDTLSRIDMCWSVSAGLAVVDTVRGADFQTRGLLLALNAGEPYRVVRALAMETAYLAADGAKSVKRVGDMLTLTRDLAQRIGHPHGIGLATWATGTSAFLQGRWKAGQAENLKAEQIFRDRCTGVSWEMATARFVSLWCAFYSGDLGDLHQRVPILLSEADARGDAYAVTNLRTAFTPFMMLCADSPAESRREAEAATSQWSREAFHLQHYNGLFARVQSLLYEGEGAEAAKLIDATWKTLVDSMMFFIQQMKIRAHHLRGCARLSAAAQGDVNARALAERDARLLEKEKAPWSLALAKLLRAGAAAVAGNTEAAAETLRSSALALDALDMTLYAAAARRQLGRLTGGDEGAALVDGCDRLFTSLQIRRPARLAAMLVPGFPLD